MINIKKSAFYLTLLYLTVGCDVLKQEQEESIVASVKKHNLYLDELNSALPENLSKSDSLNFANSFIESWATQMLLLDRAELNLPDNEKNVGGKLEEYRRSLLI